jgi:ribosomal protein S18 acetylase RimI-like enzyme
MTIYEDVAKRLRTEILGEGNEDDVWYLYMLAVSPRFKGKGIGRALVGYVTDIVLCLGKGLMVG